MRTLIYKRTHPGDPDAEGRFGIQDCMGQVRSRDFEAVIGVGGIGAEPRSHGLDGKVNWVGIGPHMRMEAGKRGPVVTFDRFLLWESDGPSFPKLAPKLAARMYSKNVRVVMYKLDPEKRAEVEQILDLAKDDPSSSTGGPGRAANPGKCRPQTSAVPIKDCSCRRAPRPAVRTNP